MSAAFKPLGWIGSSKKDLKDFPEEVQDELGFALWQAQLGLHPNKAKVLKGFQGAGVLEIIANQQGNAFRAVYTVRFMEIVYVLHAFQKKSKHGTKTPAQDIELINKRLKLAEEYYAEWKATQDQAD